MDKYGAYLVHDKKESPEGEEVIYELLRENAWQTLEAANVDFDDYVITLSNEPDDYGHRYSWVATPKGG